VHLRQVGFVEESRKKAWGKFFAITIVIIGCFGGSIVRHTWAPPSKISVHGSADDINQKHGRGGFPFWRRSSARGLVWKFSSRPGTQSHKISRGARVW